ncbi:ABC transporter ATP-binding protein [Microbacterium thalassium]|uniref:Simple sugar transport system ATP-binding protein n=1 Tax=Microbacterium thalassium TaxID=362649 RepID=A0A7X0FN24_9MICO|nr:ABC transporter ATP-binding protein [Microbacterium thalassium]MBB6390545.1 simple sugar transport system ATP-binding protein [Microbacterium thalassium]GLK25656.1 heme ABC transporter ATP-binding protein [Microbacterium thalassium]
MTDPAIRLTGITKRFGAVAANENIDLTVLAGSIHGVLGENGAGKSTLMKVLFGMVRPDDGTIEIGGVRVELRSSADALSRGIGMVQQHFSLIGRFTVAENLILGRGPGGRWRRSVGRLDLAAARERTRELSDRFDFGLDPDARCEDLSVGARQKVEIVKALWAGATTLVLDEPTAALSPPEAEELYRLLERLRADGTTVILISHKLPEIMRLCDAVTVLRDGRRVGSREIAEDDRAAGRAAFEADLVQLMIGRPRPSVPERTTLGLPAALRVRGLTLGERFGPIDIDVHGGEILAVVGVEGNGQGTLVDLLTGLARPTGGIVELDGVDITRSTTRRRFGAGIAHIPEDRHERAVADELSLIDNASIGFTTGEPFAASALWLSHRRRRRFAAALIRDQRVRAAGPDVPIASLSGGNQQKLVVGRELARAPRLMIAAQPTRGLDIASTTAVHESLLRLREGGAAVLLLSLDLAEVFEIADRIVVIRQGRIVGEVGIDEADQQQLGEWMSGARSQEDAA